MRSIGLIAVCVLGVALAGLAGTGRQTLLADEADKGAPTARVETRPTDDPLLVIGTAKLTERGVVDGDTLKAVGFKKSLRLVLIDTEEVPHPGDEKGGRALMRSDFPAYVRKMSLRSPLPTKYATPMGEEATEFARAFFKDATGVKLERDLAEAGTDTHGRTLCYVWALFADGPPRLYNLEAVRAGMSPYYTKYGRSKRFDEAFLAAHEEARAAKRGIWDPKKDHYPDYEERVAWWRHRAEALDRIDALVAKEKDEPPVVLGSRNGIRQLLRRVGDEVTVFGIVDDHDAQAVVLHENGATLRVGGTRTYIEVEIGIDLTKKLHPKRYFGQFILVRGTLDREGSPLGKNQRYLRIPIEKADQITLGHEMDVK